MTDAGELLRLHSKLEALAQLRPLPALRSAMTTSGKWRQGIVPYEASWD